MTDTQGERHGVGGKKGVTPMQRQEGSLDKPRCRCADTRRWKREGEEEGLAPTVFVSQRIGHDPFTFSHLGN